MSESNRSSGALGPSWASLADRYTAFIHRWWPCFLAVTATRPVSAHLLLSLCWLQSRFEPDTVTPEGGEGLFAMRPSEAQRIALQIGLLPPELALVPAELRDPETAICVASLYLCDLVEYFEHDLMLALLAFRLGAHLVERHGQVLAALPDNARYLRDVALTMLWLCENQPWQGPG